MRSGNLKPTVVDCPNPYCNNQGWYPQRNNYGYWEQVQCEFCYTVENSRFNLTKTDNSDRILVIRK
jgi:hypothetical protein